jgi:predicted Zn-dependent peptidase
MRHHHIQRSTRTNGVRIVSKTIPHAHSVAVGVWLINGARHQSPRENGYAHFLEHIWFKGTPQHDAGSLARTFERMGGNINAFTGRELTSLQGTVPRAHLAELLTLFSDMLLQPTFTEEDVQLERDVVAQEMAMVEDTPEDAAMDAAIEAAWAPSPLGWPILGHWETLEALDASTLRAYLQSLCVGSRLVIAAVGAVEHAALCAVCQPFAQLPSGAEPVISKPPFNAGIQQLTRETHQTQWIHLMPAPAPIDTQLPSYVIANHILGGGWSSRLFQEIRERRGLAYAVSSRLELYADTGLWSIQLGCDPDKALACQATVQSILQQLAAEGPTEAECALSLEHIESALLLEEDNLEDAMERLARDVIYLRDTPTIEARVARLRTVTRENVRQVFNAHLHGYALTWGPN